MIDLKPGTLRVGVSVNTDYDHPAQLGKLIRALEVARKWLAKEKGIK